MTISQAFNSALSGLTAAGRASGIIADNISNSLTPGYARRSLEVTSNTSTGHGVSLVGLSRHSDPTLIANRRAAEANYESAKALAGFHTRYQSLIGGPTESTSLSARVSSFEKSLIEAASNPTSKTRLDTVALRARDLSQSLNTASEGVRTMRSSADRSIGQLVNELNSNLQQVQKLNEQILSVGSKNSNTASLMDQRQLVIDRINEIVPINVIQRDYGRVALYSNNGAILLDGNAARIGFDITGETMPHMTVGNGLLSDVTINGLQVHSTGNRSPISGGLLAAQFEIRDVLAVEAQANLDAVARDLIERFEENGIDPTVAPGDPGLFTDQGSALSPSAETGLAGRVRLNSVVDPTDAGETWRLRDGLGTAAPADVGQSRQLQSFSDALERPKALGSGGFSTGLLTAAGVSMALMSKAAAASQEFEQKVSFASSAKTETERLSAAGGVDTDAEIQSLMLIERSYAANARVMEAVDDMLDKLMRL
ncbi:flagellar hook-associated protein FlgK [Primorskyibacter sp. S87]|uniref:flagellar hook-associated protein FlgK n=1 Tax=Primorskyibacter sp. S87 TaxID=3415126 RepID=UPI003C7DCB06